MDIAGSLQQLIQIGKKHVLSPELLDYNNKNTRNPQIWQSTIKKGLRRGLL